jgi:hypothetical protein
MERSESVEEGVRITCLLKHSLRGGRQANKNESTNDKLLLSPIRKSVFPLTLLVNYRKIILLQIIQVNLSSF